MQTWNSDVTSVVVQLVPDDRSRDFRHADLFFARKAKSTRYKSSLAICFIGR